MVCVGVVPIARLRVPVGVASGPVFPSGLNAIAWVDASQQTGYANGENPAVLSDRVVPTRLYTTIGVSTYTVNGRNGRPIIQRNASTSRQYAISAAPSIPANTPFLLWMVMATGLGYHQFWYNATLNHQVYFNYAFNPYAIGLFMGSTVRSVALSQTESQSWGIYLISRDASNAIRFYYNGLPKFATTPTAAGEFSPTEFLGSSGGYFICDLGEAGMISGATTTAQQNELGRYLGAKWAIDWAEI